MPLARTTRFLVKPSGRTPYETLKDQRYNADVACLAEATWAGAHGDRASADKLGAPWSGELLDELRGTPRSQSSSVSDEPESTLETQKQAGTIGGLEVCWLDWTMTVTTGQTDQTSVMKK